MAEKTFKIGEYCAGGIITARTTRNTVTIIQKEWDYSTGSRKSSDQSNAKELDRISLPADGSDTSRQLSDWLNNITTSYYSEQVLNWVKSKVKLKGYW